MIEMVLIVILLQLIAISLFDIKQQHIPLYLNLSLLMCALLYSYLQETEILNLFISTATGFLFFFTIRLITKKGLGLGDAILSAAIAVMLGIQLWLFAMTTASLLALIYILSVKYVRMVDIKKKRIPFAPFMSAGAVVFLLYQYFIN